MGLLREAEKQTYQHGEDLTIPFPDGTYKFHYLNKSQMDVTVSVNDYRLGEYHRNNGVTKLSVNVGSSFLSYVMTT